MPLYTPMRRMAGLPTGTVTLLFTDIEESTPLVHRLGDGYGAVRDQYRSLIRKAVAESDGHEVECRADEFFAVFQRAKDGAAAAVAAQRLLAAHSWPEGVSLRARIGLHTGEPAVEGGGYLGLRSEEHTSELQSLRHLVCRLLL